MKDETGVVERRRRHGRRDERQRKRERETFRVMKGVKEAEMESKRGKV